MNIYDRAAVFNKNLAADDQLDRHSKSLHHHTAMQGLFVAWYNFARRYEALKGNTPAIAGGLNDHVWSIQELLERAAA